MHCFGYNPSLCVWMYRYIFYIKGYFQLVFCNLYKSCILYTINNQIGLKNHCSSTHLQYTVYRYGWHSLSDVSITFVLSWKSYKPINMSLALTLILEFLSVFILWRGWKIGNPTGKINANILQRLASHIGPESDTP